MRGGHEALPEIALVDEIAPDDQVRHALELAPGRFRLGRARGLDRDQRLHLVGRGEGGVEAEVTALAVHNDHTRADFLDELVVGSLGLGVRGRPTGHALLEELVEGLDREELAGQGDPLGGVELVAADRADAEILPGLLLGAEEGLGREDLGVARPRGAAALDRVGDVDIVPCAQKEHLPTGLAVGLGLPGDAGKAATVPEQQRIACLRLGELGKAHVHLLHLEVTVGIDLDGRRAGGEDDVPGRQARERDRTAADVEATYLGDR